jgi:rhodanese-related sulfurtransferase
LLYFYLKLNPWRFNMNKFMVNMMLSAVVLVALVGPAAAETVKGRLKAIAPDSKLFSMIIAQGKVLLISWDDKTLWQGIGNAADLKLDENLSVDYRLTEGRSIAAAVARLKTSLPPGLKVITVDKLNSENFTLVDTRAVELYDAGHIPGAVSLPLSRLEKRTYGLLPEDNTVKLVFYDEGQGGDSAGKAAAISAKAGYADIAIYQDGATGWTESGKMLASSSAFIRKKIPVVIDVRSKEQAALGHIEKAVNYPLPELKNYFGSLPLNKLTPIVIYGASDKDAVTAAELIRNRGYRRVTIYPGGASSWENNAEVLENGPANEVTTSAAESHGGGLDASDFEMALASPVMIEIVDVRSAADHKKGGFPHSKQIPLQDLAKREVELNRDKIQVVFAADRIQAEMAYDYLKPKGFKLNYFNGSVEFEKDGKYTVK